MVYVFSFDHSKNIEKNNYFIFLFVVYLSETLKAENFRGEFFHGKLVYGEVSYNHQKYMSMYAASVEQSEAEQLDFWSALGMFAQLELCSCTKSRGLKDKTTKQT